MAAVGAVGIFFCLWVAVLGWLATRNSNGCFSVKFYRFDCPCTARTRTASDDARACAGKRA
jgi:hypothetical protein